MKKRLFFMFLCILAIIFSLTRCISQDMYSQSPEELVETYATAICARDYETVFSCMGAVLLNEYTGYIDTQPQQEVLDVTVHDIKFEKLTGSDYNEALDGITKYWLNNEDYADVIKFTYSAFDIKQIGYASCVVEAREIQEKIEQLCVFETDKGWFIAIDGM